STPPADAGIPARSVLAAGRPGPRAIVADRQGVCWAEGSSPESAAIVCCSLSKDGASCAGGPHTVATDQNDPRQRALDASYAYWPTHGTDRNDGRVNRAPR